MSSRINRFFKVQPRGQSVANRADQVRNNAGGMVFSLGPFQRLERFLILGADGPTYYSSAHKVVLDNAASVVECLALDGARTVKTIADLSDSGRAPKNDAAIFALAMAAGHPDDATRRAALFALPRVCRTGTHLFQFTGDVARFRRWGRGLRRAVAKWYEDKATDKLVYQVLKYGQRAGVSHRDVLRLAHPVPRNDAQRALFRWLTCGDGVFETAIGRGHVEADGAPAWIGALPEACHGFEGVRRADVSEEEVIELIGRHRFTHDMLPSKWKRSAAVWEAMLPEMPLGALLRGLAQLTSVGLLAPKSRAATVVCQRLTDAKAVTKARVHPISVLAALKVYGQGRGERGKLTWKPVPEVLVALDRCYELSFRALVPSGKRFLLALDVSGSMTCGTVAGLIGLNPRLASAAMAMATLRAERNCEVVGFSDRLVDVPLLAEDSLNQVVEKIERIPMGGTDCALPMLYAMERKLPVDVFVIYTDSETWFGKVHPYRALQQYREKTGIGAKLAVVGLTATQFTIADPHDSGSLDFVGFDSAAPAVMADFARA